MASVNFEYPTIDWDSASLYQEFVGFVFDGPLADLPDKCKAHWLGTWIGEQGRGIYKTFEWIEGEKDDPNKVLDKFELYFRLRKNTRIVRHRLFKRNQSSKESFDNFI